MSIALVCIAKNEDRYIDEWILYHQKIGFEKIFIYENDWRCESEYDFVEKIKFDGKVKQLEAYKHFIDNKSKSFEWVAFFDCDEFLLLKKHFTVNDFVKDFSDYSAIAINWIFFGSGGLIEPRENSLLKQFTRRDEKPDKHIKTILKLKNNSFMVSPHFSNTLTKDVNGKVVNGPFNENGDNKVCILNHYYFKTLEDWKIKLNRGRADTIKELMPNFNLWEENKEKQIEIEDTMARDFLYH